MRLASRRKQLQEELAAIDRAEKWQPRTDFTDAEKCAAFDRLHKFMLGWVQGTRDGERFKDGKHYAYEMLVENTIGKGFYKFKSDLGCDE